MAVADAAEVTTRPRAVFVDGHRVAVVRLGADAPVSAYLDHCPHRLVPLSAGTVDGGRLRCAYHGWEFDRRRACAALPSLGPDAHPPPRAHLDVVPTVREADGRVWIRVDPPPAPADRPAHQRRPGAAARLAPGGAGRRTGHRAAPGDRGRHALGGTPHRRRVCRAPGTVRAAGNAGAWSGWRREQPLTGLFDDPDAEDREYAGAWLPPVRTAAPAGCVADNFLDVAHFPFVHAGTFGAGEEKTVDGVRGDRTSRTAAAACRSSGSTTRRTPAWPPALRPLRQRRRATYVYRAPFQLMLRLEELDAGAVKTILFLLQPEDADRHPDLHEDAAARHRRRRRPGPDVVAREVAFEEAVLAEDLALQAGDDAAGPAAAACATSCTYAPTGCGVALRRELHRVRAGAAHDRPVAA